MDWPRPAAPAGIGSALPARSLAFGLTSVLLLAGMTLAWLLPPLAILVVWPMLFVVPGWGLLALARPRIGAAGRAGLAVVLSVAVSAHLVYWLSSLVGYRRETVFAAALLLAMPLPLAAWRGSGAAGLASALRTGRRSLLRDLGAFNVAVLAGAFVGIVLASGLWHVTASGVDSGGSNWSDLGVHLSIAQSLNAGNFPPQVPYFAGVPLVYHWFADFHAAIAALAAGLFAVPVFILSSAVLAGSLAAIVYALARQVLGQVTATGVQRAALIAAGFVIFGGGLGWIRFIGDVWTGAGSPLDLVAHNSYDNFWYDARGAVSWPYFRIPSVMGTGLLVHRATTAGLPILAGMLLLLMAGLPSARRVRLGWRDRPALILLAGLLGALLAPFHFFFFPAGLLLALLWVVTAGRLVDRAAPRNAILFLAPYALGLPFALAPLVQAAGSGALKWVAGWESAPMSDGPAAVAFFYLTNLGIPLVLAIVALLGRRVPGRWFLALWAIALFVVPNVIQVSVVAFDMNKYFQVMWVAVTILAAWLVRRWPAWAVAAIFAVSVPSPLLVAAWTALNREQVLSTDQLAAASWIAANTPGTAVFATDGWLNSPTDPAGRLRLTTFGPYVANLGYSPDLRASQVQQIYCGGDAAASVRLLRQLGASYLIDGSRPSPCPAAVDFSAAPGLARVYANPTVSIYAVEGAPATGSVSSGP